MPRIATLVLCAFAALVATATPASEPKPWVPGWKKVDPKGDCRFEREGERLVITVPGKGHEFDVNGRLDAPRLLREVEGDFVAEVRVSGDRWYWRKVLDTTGLRGAGIVVMADENTPAAVYEFQGQPAEAACYFFTGQIRCPTSETEEDSTARAGRSSPARKSSYLRLQRRGDAWRMSYSEDGKDWRDLLPLEGKLPRKLKVGVFAEVKVEGEFKVVFDKCKLSRLSK